MSTSDYKEPKVIEWRGEKEQVSVYNAHLDVSGVEEAKLVRKIDWRLLPWLSLLYLLSFLDRTSIGNAKVHHPIPLLEVIMTHVFNSFTIS
jgi:predicted transcriptional regulator